MKVKSKKLTIEAETLRKILSKYFIFNDGYWGESADPKLSLAMAEIEANSAVLTQYVEDMQPIKSGGPYR
jgi:hypothetical protein